MFSFQFERGDFDCYTTIVASKGYSRIDLAFTIVHRFAWILSLSRLSFAETNRTDRACVNGFI